MLKLMGKEILKFYAKNVYLNLCLQGLGKFIKTKYLLTTAGSCVMHNTESPTPKVKVTTLTQTWSEAVTLKGPDNISTHFLREFVSKNAPSLTVIFNASLKQANFI